jgi:hypothetical protein
MPLFLNLVATHVTPETQNVPAFLIRLPPLFQFKLCRILLSSSSSVSSGRMRPRKAQRKGTKDEKAVKSAVPSSQSNSQSTTILPPPSEITHLLTSTSNPDMHVLQLKFHLLESYAYLQNAAQGDTKSRDWVELVRKKEIHETIEAVFGSSSIDDEQIAHMKDVLLTMVAV